MGKRDKRDHPLVRKLKQLRPPLDFRGRYYHIARRLLADTADILGRADVKYFLDAGALLGLVREGDLIPWDHDLDFLLPHEELEKFRATFPQYRRRGWRVSDGSVMPADGPAWKMGEPRCVKIRNRNMLYFGRGRLVMDISIIYKRADSYYRGAMGRVWRLPAKYFDIGGVIDYNGSAIQVPGNTEEYLSYIYGNWQSPREEWDPHAEDGSNVGDLDNWVEQANL